MSELAFYGYIGFASLVISMISLGMLLFLCKCLTWISFIVRCVLLLITLASFSLFVYVSGKHVAAQKAIQAEQKAHHEIRIIEEGVDAYRDDIPVQCNPYIGISADDAKLWTKGWIDSRNNRLGKNNWKEWRMLQ